jgi:hypothetical protein
MQLDTSNIAVYARTYDGATFRLLSLLCFNWSAKYSNRRLHICSEHYIHTPYITQYRRYVIITALSHDSGVN